MLAQFADFEIFGSVQARRAPGALLVDRNNLCVYVYRSPAEAVFEWSRWFDCDQGLELIIAGE